MAVFFDAAAYWANLDTFGAETAEAMAVVDALMRHGALCEPAAYELNISIAESVHRAIRERNINVR